MVQTCSSMSAFGLAYLFLSLVEAIALDRKAWMAFLHEVVTVDISFLKLCLKLVACTFCSYTSLCYWLHMYKIQKKGLCLLLFWNLVHELKPNLSVLYLKDSIIIHVGKKLQE